jgi:hypothetical protein
VLQLSDGVLVQLGVLRVQQLRLHASLLHRQRVEIEPCEVPGFLVQLVAPFEAFRFHRIPRRPKRDVDDRFQALEFASVLARTLALPALRHLPGKCLANDTEAVGLALHLVHLCLDDRDAGGQGRVRVHVVLVVRRGLSGERILC